MGALLKIYTCIFVQFLSNFSCGKTVWMRLKASPALKGLTGISLSSRDCSNTPPIPNSEASVWTIISASGSYICKTGREVSTSIITSNATWWAFCQLSIFGCPFLARSVRGDSLLYGRTEGSMITSKSYERSWRSLRDRSRSLLNLWEVIVRHPNLRSPPPPTSCPTYSSW